MAIKAQSLTPHWFTPDSQKEDPTPAQFRVRPLSSAERYQLADASGSIHASAVTLLEHGLIGWKNVENPDTGEALEFNASNLWTLPSTILDEIGAHILSISHIGEDAAKN